MTEDRKPDEREQDQREVKIDDILRRLDALPVLDSRSPDEIVGYDADGLPAQG